MPTISNILHSLSSYPVSERTLESFAACRVLSLRGLTLSSQVDSETENNPGFLRLKSDVLYFLSVSPDISQDGVSYSISSEERKELRYEAMRLLNKADILSGDEKSNHSKFGYKGSRL